MDGPWLSPGEVLPVKKAPVTLKSFLLPRDFATHLVPPTAREGEEHVLFIPNTFVLWY